jgi:hypothetical protein
VTEAGRGDATEAADAILPTGDVSTVDRPIGQANIRAWRRAIPSRSAIRRSRTWTDAVLPTIALRIILLCFGVLAVVIFGNGGFDRSWLEIWNRWDAPLFAEVARNGYGPPSDPARIVLFPVFPALIRVGSWFTAPVAAGMIVAFVSTLAAAAGLYRLARFDYGRATARWSVLAMSVFPTAYALVAPYSEAPFLAFAVWAFVSARRDNWWAAGILTLLASATRIQGVFLIAALAVEYWRAHRRVDRDAAWLLVAVAGPLLYLAINFMTFGDPLYFLDIQRRVFGVTTLPPWEAIPTMLRNAAAFRPTENWATVYLAPVLAIVLLGVVTLWTAVAAKRRASYFVYTALTLASFATLSWPISVPRYVMGVFPMFLALGRVGARPSLGPPVFVASSLLLGAFLTLFVNGHWAF